MRLDLKERHSTGPFAERLIATDEETGRDVLVSMPHLSLADVDDETRQRILAAARRYKGLVHPHVCSPLDAGILRSGRLCIVQELPSSLGGKPGDSPERGGLALTHLCEALAYSHTRDLVHGVISPDCVIGADAGDPRLADFGVGAALFEAGVLGERCADVPCAAPELGSGGEPTPASDVYSLGVLGIELASPAGEGSGPQDLASRASRIPQSGLASTVSRAIQPEPASRFSGAGEMLRALRSVVAPEKRVDTPRRAAATERRRPPARKAARPKTRKAKEPRQPAVPEMSHLKAFGLLAWTSVRSLFTLIVCLALIACALAGGFALALKETPQLRQVPILEGRPVGEARALASADGLETMIGRQAYHSEVDEGHVIQQSPYPGKWVREGRGIELVVSLGEARVSTPKLVDLPRSEAKKQLASAGLLLGTVSRRQATGEPDRVLEQNPKAGTEVRVDTEVDITISVGPRTAASRDDRSGPRAADIKVTVPAGPPVQRVKVEVHYPNRRYVIAHDRIHHPGDKVKVHVVASGPASVQTLIDGKLVAKQDLEPSP